MGLRATIPSVVIVVGCVAVVFARAASVPAPEPAKRASAVDKHDIAWMVMSSEHDWEVETTKNFPSDRWSQRDDFHGREWRKVVDLAKDRGIRIEDVLRIIDDDIHLRRARVESPEARNVRAVPCKPRPFYD